MVAKMTEKLRFTQERIRNLPTPATGRVDYYDTKVPKLTCRVSSTGNKSFVVLKKNAAGTVQRITLGRFPDWSVDKAQKEAEKIIPELAQGIDHAEEKRKQKVRGITLQELLDKYLAEKTDLREASVFDYKQKINQGFSDWLDKPINKITREMVSARRNQLTGGRDNKMRVLRLLMKYAVVKVRALDENPVDVLKDGGLWSKPTRKKRMIPSDNLKAWYESVVNLSNEKAKVYLLLLLHTGLRDQDVRYLEWKDIDFKNDCFVARDTKNHSDFTAYIAPQIKPYFRGLQALTGSGQYVFPGEGKDGVMNIPVKPIAKVCKETGVTFSSHDLKRTFLTIGEAAMIPFSLLKALANHKTDADVTGGYINPEAKTLKTATFKIADYIHQHVTPDIDNVVSILKAI
jgi:integrase